MAKVEVIKRTKNWRAELVQLFKKDKVLHALLNDNENLNKDDDSGYESENWGEPWINFKHEKYITNNALEIVLRTFCLKHSVGF